MVFLNYVFGNCSGFEIFFIKKYFIKNFPAAGYRTRVSRVIGGDTHHYTIGTTSLGGVPDSLSFTHRINSTLNTHFVTKTRIFSIFIFRIK